MDRIEDTEKREARIAIRVHPELKKIIEARAKQRFEKTGEYLLSLARCDLEKNGMLPRTETITKKGSRPKNEDRTSA